MTQPVNNSTTSTNGTSSTSSSSSTTAQPQTLGENAFLQLLMAQLKNQDPLNPTDDTEFVTQLSQFSLVEQSTQQTSQLTSISTALQSLNNQNSLALVGQTVTMSGSNLAFGGSLAVTGQATLASPAASVTAVVQDSNGNTVRTMNLGAQGAGPLAVSWDGRGDDGQTEPAGTYTLTVSATDTNGQAVSVSQNVSGVVEGASLGGTTPTFTLSNGMVMPVSNLLSVGTTLNNP
jgi:flagellar basal-body rod modification protein FlgD